MRVVRQMRWHVTTVSMLAAFAIGAFSPADAAISAWGCKGDSGGVQIFFNRDVLVVLKGRTTALTLKQIVHGGDAISKSADGRIFSPDSGDLDEKTLLFTNIHAPGEKITLTEKSSRQTGNRVGELALREEIWTSFRKVYSYSITGELTRVVTMDCANYLLSTKGGRRLPE